MAAGGQSYSVSMKVYDSPHENDLIGSRSVGSILDEAVDSGAIVFDKPRAKLTREDEGSRDLFAYAALCNDGWQGMRVLPERNERNSNRLEYAQYPKSVDMVLANGDYWELKSPTTGSNPESMRFVERNLRRAVDQFEKHPSAHEQPVRVVFNGRYVRVSDTRIAAEITAEMQRLGVSEVVQVCKDGSIQHHRL